MAKPIAPPTMLIKNTEWSFIHSHTTSTPFAKANTITPITATGNNNFAPKSSIDSFDILSPFLAYWLLFPSLPFIAVFKAPHEFSFYIAPLGT